jgi:aminoglycoside/choline kinase family phosphotransferase
MSEYTAIANATDSRRAALTNWLHVVLGRSPCLQPVSTDASFRRYFRLRAEDGSSLIAMDAPPAQENTAQFIAVGRLMAAAGLHVPEVHAAEPAAGFALLSDLGTRTYLDAIEPGNIERLIEDALVALVRWQAATRDDVLSRYDEATLRCELALFSDWYVERHLGRAFNAAQSKSWERLCDTLVSEALAQPQVFVHRDFILRNLMVSEPNPGVIDFQDALLGPVGYDVASLFRDAFYGFGAGFVERGVRRYLELARAADVAVPAEDAAFTALFDRIGLQRHLKVVGIFARLAHRDQKPKYLDEIPRFIGYLRQIAPRYPDTEALMSLLDALEAPR